jgi:hypothetical protein
LFGGEGGADLVEGGREVGRRVVEASAGVTDGDTDELDASLASSEGAEGGVLLGMLCELVLAAEFHAKADLELDEGSVLAVEGIGARSGVG